jgi:hypothetical protein
LNRFGVNEIKIIYKIWLALVEISDQSFFVENLLGLIFYNFCIRPDSTPLQS